HYIIGFIGIVTGCLAWWWVVTYVVDKVRSRFSLHSLLMINRFIGIVILIFAVVGIVTGISSMTS
ncbi:MAG: LysE family translocator, partial [Muribaculaceae bacterium]|nr:LysE family translocator [Muribaculaceae bacterium]